MIPTKVLVEWRSKPVYNPIQHLLKVKIGSLTSSIPLNDMLGRCPLYDYQLNVVQLLATVKIYERKLEA
jgi:hypothetical protein